MLSLQSLWDSAYTRLIIIFIVCYILFNAFGSPLDLIDYVLIVYILNMSKINEENALGYAVVFGLAYDFRTPIFLGLGILLFQLFNLAKIQAYSTFDMTKSFFIALYIAAVCIVYLLATLKFAGYPPQTYWLSFFTYLKFNLPAALVLAAFFGGNRGFSYSKR